MTPKQTQNGQHQHVGRGQRHWAFLKGGLQTEAQPQALETAVRNMDDIKSVINLLMAGANGTPHFKVAASTQK